MHSPDERPYLAVNKRELHVIATELEPDGSQHFHAVNPTGEVIDRFDNTDTS